MAKLIPGVEFTGSIGSLSAYRMRGVNGIVLRHKTGPSRASIKTSEKFANTRRVYSEFGGRSTATKWIMQMLHPLKALADYNIAGPLNALLKPIQKSDTKGAWGERKILLTNNPAILEGFSLNRETNFESIVRAPITCSISRETLTAEGTIPELMPDINFKPNAKYRLYSFQAVLGVVPNIFYTDNGYGPSLEFSSTPLYACRCVVESPWFATLQGSAAQTLTLKLDSSPPDNHFTLMLSIGIRYGSHTGVDTIEQMKYAGAAKIVRAV